MTALPRFSIVIPTRDRPGLVGAAVRSALTQTCGDFELIVSDNSAGDATMEVVGAFHDDRIRYLRTPGDLLMHESWRFALKHARGEYVSILCDDDALHPGALALAEQAIARTGSEALAWRSCSYCSQDWLESSQRGRVRFGPPFSDRMFDIDGARLIDDAYGLRITFSDLVPKLLNGVLSRAVIERAHSDGAELFHPSCPDYSAMLVQAVYARRIVLLDAPLYVAGATPQSIGACSMFGAAAAQRFIEELMARGRDLVLPAAVGPRITWLAQTFMQCARDVPALSGRTVDPASLYGLARLELEQAHRAGADVDEHMRRWEDALAGPLAGHAEAIGAFIAQRPAIESEAHLAPIDGLPPVTGRGAFHAASFSAQKAGLDSIDDVASHLDELLDVHGRSIGALWEAMAARLAGRTPVLYGLGLNGRALLRALPEAAHPIRRSLAVCDDHAIHIPDELARIASSEALRPEKHLVLVTLQEPDALMARLARRGFMPTRDLFTMQTGAARSAGALAPS